MTEQIVSPRVAFHTLGCKVNQGETAAMAELFRRSGYLVVEFDQPADVYIVNTCAVTVQAERRSRQAANRVREHNPAGLVVMVGCYPQVADKQQLESLAAIDLLVGSSDKPRIVELVEQARQDRAKRVAVSDWAEVTEFAAISSGQEPTRTRANLKIQDGCQQFCSYCIIPYARGPERSHSPNEALAEAEALLAAGFQEIVLTGIHVGRYGRDLQPPLALTDLLSQLLKLPGIRRLRLSSVEPNEITASLLGLMREYPQFCRHLHIPLQAGNDQVLRAMNRHYSTEDYRQTVALIRSFVPEVALTTDVIVGFPGETEAAFLNTCELVREIGFSRLHVFRYSRRPGTVAAAMAKQIAAKDKERRSRELTAISTELARSFASRLLGQSVAVLWEHQKDGLWSGHTDTHVQVYAAGELPARNQLQSVQLRRLLGDGIYGEVLA